MDKISKQDANTGRNLQDLKKYFLNLFTGVKKNVETSQDALIKVENELNNFVSSTTESIIKLQNQIDGNITTWFLQGTPNLNNKPTSDWKVNEYPSHLGDLYYDTDTGYSYRFALQEETYLWIKITDSDVTEALALASNAKDTADNKRRVFTTTPLVPYDVGDLWLNNEELYVCIKASTQTYSSSHFEKATEYTDDTGLNNFINGEYIKEIQAINEQIDKKAETWCQDTDPSTAWTTTELKATHVGDLWHNTNEKKNYIYTASYTWQESDGVPDSVYDKIDGKAQIFTTQPTPPYYKGDLYTQGNDGDILVCSTERLTGNYNKSDWIKAGKYTDDTALNNFVNVTYAEAMKVLTNQIDGKVSTWYYSGKPTLSNAPANGWITDEEKISHTGDLYYDKSTGYTYIFENIDSSYQWTKITDEDIVQAMALANSAKDTADSKRRVFVEQPTPPYDNGDLWIKNEEIYICQISKEEGQPYKEQDFVIATKYTDDTVAKAIVDEMGGTTTTVLNGQVVTITKSFAKFTDLADPTSSTTIAGEHITTGNIKSNNYIKDVSGTKINLEDGTIDTKNFKVDENGNISLYNGAKVIGDNGLMTSYMQSEEGFVGYALVDPGQSSNEASKTNILIEVVIPEGFEITKAKITGYHTPIFWGYQDINYMPYTAWGYARKLKLYKATNMYSKKMTAQLFSEYEQESTTEYEEISGALGSNGWTATAPSDTSHNTEKFESSDIKSIFQNSGKTAAGLYQIKIESTDNPLASWGTKGIVERSGHITAMLIIEGYMTYQ